MPKPTAAHLAPVPQSPTGGDVVPLDAATFRWTAPPGTASFDLRIAAADAADAPLVEIDGLPSTETTLASALPTGDLLWWVRTTGGRWSAPSSFRAGTPADLEVAQKEKAVEDERERAKARENQRAGLTAISEAPPDPVWPHATGEALEGAPDLDWSTVPGFGAPAPADVALSEAQAPHPTAPLGGEIVDAVTVTLQWTGVPGARAYDIQISPHSTFDRDVLALEAGQATEVSLPGLVPAVGRKLLWRVRARLEDGATPWSRYGRFYPAGSADVDRFQTGFDAAIVAQRRQREHAALLRQREMDLIPLHERADAVTSTAAVGAVLMMVATGLIVGIIAVVLSFMMTH